MTFLDHIGNAIKKILGIANASEPLVDLGLAAAGLGGIIPLYNSALGLATGAQALAPTVSGTGPQKLAQLTASLLPMAKQFAVANRLSWPDAEIQKWASAVVDTMNLIPAPTLTAVTSTIQVAPGGPVIQAGVSGPGVGQA